MRLSVVGAAAVSGAGWDASRVWVAAAIVGGVRGVIVGETDFANPPQARIGKVNKTKSRFMVRKVYR
jgi:hypothetical protein